MSDSLSISIPISTCLSTCYRSRIEERCRKNNKTKVNSRLTTNLKVNSRGTGTGEISTNILAAGQNEINKAVEMEIKRAIDWQRSEVYVSLPTMGVKERLPAECSSQGALFLLFQRISKIKNVVESAPSHILSVPNEQVYIPYSCNRSTYLTMTTAEKSKADSNIIIENLKLGIWDVKIAKTSGHILVQWWTDIKSAAPLFYRLCSDIFTLSPRLFTFFLFCQLWQGVEDALLMHFSSLLLRQVCHNCLYFSRLLIQYM